MTKSTASFTLFHNPLQFNGHLTRRVKRKPLSNIKARSAHKRKQETGFSVLFFPPAKSNFMRPVDLKMIEELKQRSASSSVSKLGCGCDQAASALTAGAASGDTFPQRWGLLLPPASQWQEYKLQPNI